MTYSLTIWSKPGSDEKRIYVNGTTRSAVYFHANSAGVTTWSSKTYDTPHRFQTGDHYGKVRKDRDAANDVASIFGITLGETPFADALDIAARGDKRDADGVVVQIEG